MLDFFVPTLADKPMITDAVRRGGFRGADFNFNNMILWRSTYHPLVAKFGDGIIIMSGSLENPFYFCPIATGGLPSAIDAIIEDAERRGAKARIRGITDAELPEFMRFYGDTFEITADERSFDYIYSIDKLADLPGKKLHAKRTHINRFDEQNDWSFEPITADNIAECRAMCMDWMRIHTEKTGSSYSGEKKALASMFRNFDRLELDGGMIRSSGRVVAFSVGGVLAGDTYDIHFEKAYADIQGSYAVINREFARYVREKHPEIVYINREEDMGLPGLRKAKQSYYPDILLKKYTAVRR